MDPAASLETTLFAGVAMLLVKLTLWCALPFALRPLLARGSASLRHLLLTLTLAGTLVLPALLLTAPEWQAPSWLRMPVTGGTGDIVTASSASPPSVAASSVTASSAALPNVVLPRVAPAEARRLQPRAARSQPRSASRALPRQTAAAVVAPTLPAPRSLSPTRVIPSRSRLIRTVSTWLGLIWLAGAAVVVLRTVAAIRGASRLVREATPLDEPRAAAAMRRAHSRLHAAPEAELRQSRRFPVPFAWRGLRSAVVLPSSWRRWDDERLTVVLVHELAHLGRRDALALAIGRAATALWWFHPLVRRLETWARQECEQAADDAVLLSGSRASDYADHLLAIGRALTRPLPTGVALTMSNSPDLKHRLLAILRADQPRRVLTRRFTLAATFFALGLAVVLAGVRFTPTAYAQEPEPDEVDVEAEVEDGGRIIVHEHEHHVIHRHRDHDHDHDCDSCDSDSEWDSDSYASMAGRSDWKRAAEAHDEGRYEESIAGFEAAAEAGFRPAVSTYNAACGYSLSGRDDEALVALGRALELGLDEPELLAEDSDLDPLRADARFQALVDEAFELAGERRDPIEHYRYRSALEGLEVLRETDSQDDDAWAEVGTALLQLRQLDAAAEALDTAARLDDSPAIAFYNLACAQALADRPGDALDALERSIEAGYSDPDHMRRDPDLASLRGDREFERLVDLADALDLDRFRRAFWRQRSKAKDKDKHGWQGHHGWNNNEYSAETWAPAIDFYRGFVDEHPSLGAGWFNLGYALHFSKRFDESVDAFRRAEELGYRPATSIYNVACGYSMLNRVDEAFAALEEAVGLGFRGGDLDDDSDLENLRQDPRFRSLRLKMRYERHS